MTVQFQFFQINILAINNLKQSYIGSVLTSLFPQHQELPPCPVLSPLLFFIILQ